MDGQRTDREGGGSFNCSCPECGAAEGTLHDLFCCREICPFCNDFMSTCDCIFRVLCLSDEERKVVEEYVDDSVEPLRGICKRWREALQTVGRIPY